MITVIIPTLNEEKAIDSVVAYVKRSPQVGEVIVVDDKSLDCTVDRAREAGAKIITSTKLGKGASMRDGLLVAQGDIIVYLDGDISSYAEDAIEKLTAPILRGEADFVKATFQRDAGRVTELVAKPLLTLLIPELSRFSQPLSGMIAGKKSLLDKLTFENDYGVDIGLLIDAHFLGARIVEVSIGSIVNKSKTWTELSPMAREVARAILNRASRFPSSTLGSLEIIQIVRDQMDLAIRESVRHLKKMVAFDMDNTLLRGRFIDCAAKKFGFVEELQRIRSEEKTETVRTKKIAQLLKGRTIGELLKVTDAIPIVHDAIEVIRRLKKRGFWTGIITDSYDAIALHIQHKIGADFAIGNELEFSQSVATGEVKIPSFLMHTEKSMCPHDFCKSNALLHLAAAQGIDVGNIIAVGDSFNDLCMIKFAGIGVAFCSNDAVVNAAANLCIRKPSLTKLLRVAR
ncbi:MAG: HAD-IB family phosphatase [Candidatus Peribacteraceae bacterium]|nr:HAD-IB family phosphatase [Candidatus Peribacteraceae bacterium]MDD5074603.1 HAD-IB family phosphatase [Candidatus Peribacteraceae bacterium]